MPLNPTVIADKNIPMAFIVEIGNSDIMFTCHVDTVHAKLPFSRQRVILKDGLYQKEDNQPLGADDAAGVWLLINMINAKVPGVYAFFRGEECGGIGSSYCAKYRPELFNDIKCAIAFDRRGMKSIITHQAMSRGCSDEFGLSLAKVIGMEHELDDSGIYTDTAEFFDLVTNCTNVSVGYQHEHSKNEILDKAYIEALRDRLLIAKWDQLDHTAPVQAVTTATYLTSTSRPLFDVSSAIGATDIADFIYDNAHVLPRQLQEEALHLAQKIYKRFEG